MALTLKYVAIPDISDYSDDPLHSWSEQITYATVDSFRLSGNLFKNSRPDVPTAFSSWKMKAREKRWVPAFIAS